MSDQERGAYTPPREPPLQFDARRSRDAQPMPMALIGSGAVLVVLLGGVIAAYTGVFGHKDEAPKTVGDKVVVMKTAPPAGRQVASDPAAKLEVFSDRPAPTSPVFAPEPEKPAPRPTLQVRPSTPPPLRIAPADEAPSKSAPVAATVQASPKRVAATDTTLPAKQASPRAGAATDLSTARAGTPASSAATKAAATPKVAATGSVGAQIGAFSSRELADKGFADVGKLASTAGRGKRIEAVEHGDSTLYRTTVTGFADRDAAKAFCADLAAKGHACIVKG